MADESLLHDEFKVGDEVMYDFDWNFNIQNLNKGSIGIIKEISVTKVINLNSCKSRFIYNDYTKVDVQQALIIWKHSGVLRITYSYIKGSLIATTPKINTKRFYQLKAPYDTISNDYLPGGRYYKRSNNDE